MIKERNTAGGEPARWPRKCGLKIFYDAVRRGAGQRGRIEEGTSGRGGYFHRLCPTAPRKYSGAKYVNERNTSCKSEGTSKAKASYLQLDIVPVEQKKRRKGAEERLGSPVGKGGRERGREPGSSRAAFNPPRWVTALENLRLEVLNSAPVA